MPVLSLLYSEVPSTRSVTSKAVQARHQQVQCHTLIGGNQALRRLMDEPFSTFVHKCTSAEVPHVRIVGTLFILCRKLCGTPR